MSSHVGSNVVKDSFKKEHKDKVNQKPIKFS